MTEIKYGLTSWDAVELNKPNFQKKKDEYMRLENGSNVMRCITRPHQYLVHNFKDPGDTGYGDKIMCSSFHGSCPICDTGDRPKRRWFVGVIERKTQVYKLLDMSSSVFKAIQELSRDEDYGDPSKYDIDVKVDKQGGASGYYTVIPKPPKPLTAADVDTKSKVDASEIARKCTPPTAEDVLKRIDFVRERKAVKSGTAPAKTAATTPTRQSAAPVAVDMGSVDSSDDEYVFESAT